MSPVMHIAAALLGAALLLAVGRLLRGLLGQVQALQNLCGLRPFHPAQGNAFTHLGAAAMASAPESSSPTATPCQSRSVTCA